MLWKLYASLCMQNLALDRHTPGFLCDILMQKLRFSFEVKERELHTLTGWTSLVTLQDH
jgi:hypothetical protein